MDVKLENITRSYGTTAALHDVSLDIASGELLALLGPSGSGKTTLLRILGGLDVPTSGRVLFGGEDALKLAVGARNVGFVFQSYALFRHMTVFDNVAFGLRVRPARRRLTRAAIADRVSELLSLVQLDHLGGRYPTQLSGGQQQRVALARALAIEPRMLLLDEPFGALDAKVRRELRRWLRDLHDRTGHTTVFVTHDQEEAVELADRVAVLNHGHLEQVGNGDDIYDAPASPFVFGFIGESSSLPVVVEHGVIRFCDRVIGRATEGQPNGLWQLSFRPHDVEVSPDLGDERITGTIIAHRRHGGARRVVLAIEHAPGNIEVDVAPAAEVGPGRKLAVLPTRWRLFPRTERG